MSSAAPAEPEYVELGESAWGLIDALREARQARDVWSAKADELSAQLLTLAGPARKALINGRHVFTVIPARVQDRFDTPRFKAAMPDLYRDFLTAQHVRGSVRLLDDKSA